MWSVFYVYRIEGITTRYVTLIQQQQGQIAYKHKQSCALLSMKCGTICGLKDIHGIHYTS